MLYKIDPIIGYKTRPKKNNIIFSFILYYHSEIKMKNYGAYTQIHGDWGNTVLWMGFIVK